MKKSLLLLMTASVATALTLGACHKHDDEDENDKEAPVLTIESPAENAALKGEIHVHGNVTDKSLHEMEIKVTEDVGGAVLLDVSPKVHDETDFDFDEHFTKAVSSETAVTLTITVSDHGDNTTTKTVKFKLIP
jgi:hypothetical protein